MGKMMRKEFKELILELVRCLSEPEQLRTGEVFSQIRKYSMLLGERGIVQALPQVVVYFNFW